jgi:DNA replication protein DnaC
MRLEGMRSAYDEVSSIGQKQGYTAEKILLSLLEAESAERETRGLRYRLSQAKFPISKEVSGFDYPYLPVIFLSICLGHVSTSFIDVDKS